VPGAKEKGRCQAALLEKLDPAFRLALARLETRVALADHENLAATAHDLAVAMAGLGGFEGRQHFHGTPRNGMMEKVNVGFYLNRLKKKLYATRPDSCQPVETCRMYIM
jgi:hypothetical protein